MLRRRFLLIALIACGAAGCAKTAESVDSGANKTAPEATPTSRSSAVASTSAKKAPVVAQNIAMPPGSTVYSQKRGAGNEGTPFVQIWVATPQDKRTVAKWFNDPARKLTTSTAWDDAWDARDGTYVKIYSDPTKGLAPNGFPKHSKTWIFVNWDGKPSPCPPCPDGYSGTLQPGCNCP